MFESAITDPAGRTVSFGYDMAGRVTQETLPDGRVIGYTYDANGNVTSITPPGRPSHSFTYTGVNLENGYLPPNIGAGTNNTTYTYNLDKQLATVTRPDGQTVGYVYDSGGKLNGMVTPLGNVSYVYEPQTGKLANVTAPNGEKIAYSYDGTLITGKTWSGNINGSVGYAYNRDLFILSETVNGINEVRWKK